MVTEQQEEKKEEATGGFWTNLLSYVVTVETQEPKTKEELEQELHEEIDKFNQHATRYVELVKINAAEIKKVRSELDHKIITWKKIIVETQIERSSEVYKYAFENQKQKNSIKAENYSAEKVSLVIQDFLDSYKDKVAFHEPHCRNYRLIQRDRLNMINIEEDDIYEHGLMSPQCLSSEDEKEDGQGVANE